MHPPTPARRSIVVHGSLAAAEVRLALGRERAHGSQVMTFEQAVARLAGGFARPIEADALREAIHQALRADPREVPLGELDAIRDLPGTARAAADTLYKCWRAGIDLEARAREARDAGAGVGDQAAGSRGRLRALAALERAALARLPGGMKRPADLVAAAEHRLAHAPAVLGALEIRGLTQMAPCWRPLLARLAGVVTVRWVAGPREVPVWLDEMNAALATPIVVERAEPASPALKVYSCADSAHEIVEALRWARALMAEGRARPEEIAIAAASPAEFDDHMESLAAQANLDVHFVHGRRALASADGQAAAALAELLLRGLSRGRVERLVRLLRGISPEIDALPENWHRSLPQDAPLLSLDRWRSLLENMAEDGSDQGREDVGQPKEGALLLSILEDLDRGPPAAGEVGERLLKGPSLAIWRKALKEGPPEALDVTLSGLRLRDGLEPTTSIAWMPASALAASPRRFVRLVGLSSRAWPRPISEDRLLPEQAVPLEELDPLPVAEADRRDFRTILATTGPSQAQGASERGEVAMSRSRRDAEGRELGRSPLLPLKEEVPEAYLAEGRVPEHAMSEPDRLLARQSEFAHLPVAASARACWRDWHRAELTARDGLVRENHPVVLRALERPQSATSLGKLLRDPLGWLWTYALGWRATDVDEEPLSLDALAFGNLMHEILDRAVRRLEADGGLAAADPSAIAVAVEAARSETAVAWEKDLPVPPLVVWRRFQEMAAALASNALAIDPADPEVRGDDGAPGGPMEGAGEGRNALPGRRSWTEIPFGVPNPLRDDDRHAARDLPWDPALAVEIPDAGLTTTGKIDRLDLTAAGDRAWVVDYKSGKVPRKPEEIVLKGGSELQRCLYGFAVKALLGETVDVRAGLLYPREGGGLYLLPDADQVLTTLSGFLRLARQNMADGLALPGIDAESERNDLAFALPGNAKAVYCETKGPPARTRLGEATAIWDLD